MNILVCGDSHANIFTYCNYRQQDFLFDVCAVGGATAQGLVNPNSKTNALGEYEKKLNSLKKKANKIIFLIGEVDCGFVIWVRSKKYNISVDEQINNCVTNLFNFIKNIVIDKYGYTNENIIVAGTVLPTIKDSTNPQFLLGERREVTENQLTRTKKTLEYNDKLEKECIKNNYKYFDITEYLFGGDCIVKTDYLNNNPYDHHLDSGKTYNFWLDELKKII
jgi:hypothetical protein